MTGGRHDDVAFHRDWAIGIMPVTTSPIAKSVLPEIRWKPGRFFRGAKNVGCSGEGFADHQDVKILERLSWEANG